MKRRSLVGMVTLACAIGLSVQAQTIPLVNADFELPATGKIGTDWGLIPGWSSDSAPGDSGVEEGWAPVPGGGTWSGYLRNPDPAVWQTTAEMIAADTMYILSVQANNNWNADGLGMTLYYDDAGSRVPAATTTAAVLENGGQTDWPIYSLSFNANDVPAAIGNALGVEFQNVSTSTDSWIGFDNVSLVIPEPGTLALMALGTLVLGLRRRR